MCCATGAITTQLATHAGINAANNGSGIINNGIGFGGGGVGGFGGGGNGALSLKPASAAANNTIGGGGGLFPAAMTAGKICKRMYIFIISFVLFVSSFI
jgi:hypothetical protein